MKIALFFPKRSDHEIASAVMREVSHDAKPEHSLACSGSQTAFGGRESDGINGPAPRLLLVVTFFFFPSLGVSKR